MRVSLPIALASLFLGAAGAGASGDPVRRPNVLFLAIDDLNDWTAHLGGHPLARTPNLDRLAARGTAFLNAHVQAPLCNPSRTSVMLGLRPSTTGVYGGNLWFRTLAAWRDRVSLPQHFAAHGYRTLGTGKLHHRGPQGGSGGGSTKRTDDTSGTLGPEFQVAGAAGGIGARPERKLVPPTPHGDHPAMDWGWFPHQDEDKGDYQVASWTVEQIQRADRDSPFFLAAGFSLPHVPCYATKKWFDLYPDDNRVLPEIKEDDRADTPRFSWYLHWRVPEPRLRWLREVGQWRGLARAYLASISFVDAQVGRILDALDASELGDSTIIVLWSDHGYHLGEKGISGKNTLWERSSRVPLIFAGPGVKAGQRCVRPAELLDIYPTLVELCHLAPRSDLDGLSLVPQLRDASAERERPAMITHNRGNHGIRSERWRYIRYADGSEELYDMQADPHEWINLAAQPRFAAILEKHRQWLPRAEAPPAPGDVERVLTYDKTADEAVWENRITIRRSSPIP
jgi:arylsulfatase A-like enzyme